MGVSDTFVSQRCLPLPAQVMLSYSTGSTALHVMLSRKQLSRRSDASVGPNATLVVEHEPCLLQLSETSSTRIKGLTTQLLDMPEWSDSVERKLEHHGHRFDPTINGDVTMVSQFDLCAVQWHHISSTGCSLLALHGWAAQDRKHCNS